MSYPVIFPIFHVITGIIMKLVRYLQYERVKRRLCLLNINLDLVFPNTFKSRIHYVVYLYDVYYLHVSQDLHLVHIGNCSPCLLCFCMCVLQLMGWRNHHHWPAVTWWWTAPAIPRMPLHHASREESCHH